MFIGAATIVSVVVRGEKPSRRRLDTAAGRLRLPFPTPVFIDRIIAGSIDQAGRRMLYLLITTWDVAGGGPFAASAIATVSLSKTVDSVQNLLIGPIFARLLTALGADRVKFRASLCASQLVGLGIARYAVRSEPIRSMDVNTLVNAVAPTLRRYLLGDIS